VHTPGPAPIVLAEPGQVEQIVMNLVVNARDAMPDGGTIAITADIVRLDAAAVARYPDLRPGDFARIAVQDTGTGIDLEHQRHVFEPFFTTKDPSRGGGLGLSIVYGIATEAGGTVTLTSAPGYGATFEVLMPVPKLKLSGS
jgi:signal transduction histidine kinase